MNAIIASYSNAAQEMKGKANALVAYFEKVA
jgi:hypothetical protein